MKLTTKIKKYGDVGTPELRQHIPIDEYVADGGQLVAKYRHDSRVHEYYKRKMITEAQYEAARRLWYWYAMGVLSQHTVAIQAYKDRVDGGGYKEMSPTEHQRYCYEQYTKAYKTLMRSCDVGILTLIVCEEINVDQVASIRHKHDQAIKRDFLIALDKLEDYLRRLR